jgi:hypothetical protein
MMKLRIPIERVGDSSLKVRVKNDGSGVTSLAYYPIRKFAHASSAWAKVAPTRFAGPVLSAVIPARKSVGPIARHIVTTDTLARFVKRRASRLPTSVFDPKIDRANFLAD